MRVGYTSLVELRDVITDHLFVSRNILSFSNKKLNKQPDGRYDALMGMCRKERRCNVPIKQTSIGEPGND